MKYFRVVEGDVYDYSTGHTTIQNELLTERERLIRFPCLRDICFEIVEISKAKVYHSFGARFEIK